MRVLVVNGSASESAASIHEELSSRFTEDLVELKAADAIKMPLCEDDGDVLHYDVSLLAASYDVLVVVCSSSNVGGPVRHQHPRIAS